MRLGLSCLLAGLLLSGLPAPVARLVLPGASPSRQASEETSGEDPERNKEDSTGSESGHFGLARGGPHGLSRSPNQGRSMPDRPTTSASDDHARLAHPARGLRDGGGHFLAEGRSFRQWIQSHLC